MPAIDQCHEQIVRALEKTGWTINPKPLTLDLHTRQLFVDILAQRTNEDEQQQIIVVEVKCFANYKIETTDLYTAIGQYLVYRSLLPNFEPPLNIYLAVPTHAYHGIFKEIGNDFLQSYKIKIIVVNLQNEEIEEWLE